MRRIGKYIFMFFLLMGSRAIYICFRHSPYTAIGWPPLILMFWVTRAGLACVLSAACYKRHMVHGPCCMVNGPCCQVHGPTRPCLRPFAPIWTCLDLLHPFDFVFLFQHSPTSAQPKSWAGKQSKGTCYNYPFRNIICPI